MTTVIICVKKILQLTFEIAVVIMKKIRRGVAQLGLERLLWEQEVGGSNPLTPTIYGPVAQLDRAPAF